MPYKPADLAEGILVPYPYKDGDLELSKEAFLPLLGGLALGIGGSLIGGYAGKHLGRMAGNALGGSTMLGGDADRAERWGGAGETMGGIGGSIAGGLGAGGMAGKLLGAGKTLAMEAPAVVGSGIRNAAGSALGRYTGAGTANVLSQGAAAAGEGGLAPLAVGQMAKNFGAGAMRAAPGAFARGVAGQVAHDAAWTGAGYLAGKETGLIPSGPKAPVPTMSPAAPAGPRPEGLPGAPKLPEPPPVSSTAPTVATAPQSYGDFMRQRYQKKRQQTLAMGTP